MEGPVSEEMTVQAQQDESSVLPQTPDSDTKELEKDDAGRIALAAYTPDEDYYAETIFLQTLKKRRVLRFGGIILILLSGIQMTRNVSNRERFLLLGALSLAGLFFFAYAQYAHIIKGKIAMRKIKKQAGGSYLPQLVHEYYEDRIEIHAEKSENRRTYPFSKITEIRQTKDMTLFIFGKEYSISVPHNAFQFGTAEKLRSHIKANYQIKKFS